MESHTSVTWKSVQYKYFLEIHMYVLQYTHFNSYKLCNNIDFSHTISRVCLTANIDLL